MVDILVDGVKFIKGAEVVSVLSVDVSVTLVDGTVIAVVSGVSVKFTLGVDVGIEDSVIVVVAVLVLEVGRVLIVDLVVVSNSSIKAGAACTVDMLISQLKSTVKHC